MNTPSSNATQRPAESKYRVALIGVGHRGYNTHFLNVLDSRSESIIAVCDVHPRSLDTFRAKHSSVPAYSSIPDLLKDHQPDFAVVAVPHKYHLSVISQLAAANIPVLKEKPAASSASEFATLKALNVRVGVAYQKRFEPRYIQFQKLLPLIGDISSFRATLAMNIEDLESTWRAADAVGVTEDLGSHMIDLIVWLFGAPSSVSAHQVQNVRRFQSYGGEDVSNILMQWSRPKHFIGHIHLSRVAHKAEESIVVTGRSGTLLLDGKNVTLLNSDGTEAFSMVDKSTKQTVVRSMLRSFGDYACGRVPDFTASTENLVDSVSTLEKIYCLIKANSPNGQVPSATEGASLDGEHFVWPLITPGAVSSVVDQMHTSLSIYNRSGIYETFEDRWREMHGLKHALVCSSGTTAIHAMFEAIQLMPGDEVLAPVYTFFATATPMLQFGAVPIFCDSLPDGNMDPEEILRRATNKTKAVIVTHMWGLPCDMPTIVKHASKLGIKVLEDCSHAHGAKVAGKLVGTWGDAAAWSLQAKKNITGGQAGVLATNSDDIYARAVTHGHFNKRAKQEVPENHPMRKFWLTGLGLNLRAHPLAIAMANHQLDCMPNWMSCREKYATMLVKRLSAIPFLRMPEVGAGDRHAWYAFVMTFDAAQAPKGLTREIFVSALEKRGLKEVDIPRSTGLLHDLPIFTHSHEAIPCFGNKPWHAQQTGFPVAQEFFDAAIKLPVWATEQDQPIVEFYADTFVDVARMFMRKGGENVRWSSGKGESALLTSAKL
ncbi:DegT/DnrJ/EryC1/StrS aminotransferase family-domain-containing protein [Hygrophoropsis aurantiaca]|uniref:DegT/DnrJ/EryC1/StrS aminotransferase family-domain-containing protein n=1 Tax=Hygrophoropsis aurantiaca TaxID=72124 RepID=A0ACB8A3B1_9AGAM|nr:DegT/DnrJ/EryC1/StrS aminotransferase family-domain-containing protein [Hygrophoropsis aurantiaca]